MDNGVTVYNYMDTIFCCMVEKTSGAKKWFPNICLRNRRISLSRTVIHNSLQQCQPLNSLLIKNTFSRILHRNPVQTKMPGFGTSVQPKRRLFLFRQF